MTLWKLSPVDLSHRNWDASTHKGPAIVRAPSENIARHAASIAFGMATRSTPGEDVKFTPWRHGDLVRAERVTDPRWPDDGPVAILDPEHHNDAVARVKFRDE